MAEYCVNKYGKHEVHKVANCDYLPEKMNRETFFANTDKEAMERAKTLYANADGCGHCMLAYNKNKT